MVKGECNCGAVTFEVTADVRDVYVCHCSICRRATGANGIAVVVVPNESFRWCAGLEHVTSWKKPEADWQTWFCAVCGSRVPGMDNPRTMFIPVGTITSGGEALRVAHHIWVDSRAPWDVIGDDGQLHPESIRS